MTAVERQRGVISDTTVQLRRMTDSGAPLEPINCEFNEEGALIAAFTNIYEKNSVENKSVLVGRNYPELEGGKLLANEQYRGSWHVCQ